MTVIGIYTQKYRPKGRAREQEGGGGEYMQQGRPMEEHVPPVERRYTRYLDHSQAREPPA